MKGKKVISSCTNCQIVLIALLYFFLSISKEQGLVLHGSLFPQGRARQQWLLTFYRNYFPWIYCLHFSPVMPFYLQICFTSISIKFQFVSFAVSSCNLSLQQEWWKLESRIPNKNEPTKALSKNFEMLLQKLMWYCRSIAALFLPVFCKQWFLLHTSSATSPKLSELVISNSIQIGAGIERPTKNWNQTEFSETWLWQLKSKPKSNWT